MDQWALAQGKALLWKEMAREELTVATHDTALAVASRAHGLAVVGVKTEGR